MTHAPAPDPFSLATGLDRIRAAGQFRRRQVLASAQGAAIQIEGRSYVNFSSNDYLGLANDARLVQAFQAAAATYGVGSGASQLISGYSRVHAQLEETLAARLGRTRALLFSSGYLANLAVVTSFAKRREDQVVMDRDNHASLIDGALLTRAGLRRYAHHDLAGLENLLGKGRTLVATDGVFSMDGSIAALPDLAALCARHGALLAVDDAHGFGVLGASGAGSPEHFSLDQNQVPILMATFGKACGAMGAFVAGPEDVIETLIQTGRTCIYSTAMPPALAAAATTALDLSARENWRRDKLQALVQRFAQGAQQLDLPVLPSTTPIQGFMVGSAAAALSGSEYLRAAGLWVTAIRAPTVAQHTERLRIALSAGHSEEQVDRLLEHLAQLARRLTR
ncbi:MAG: 8-amino-7-oxononanoate synthase [Gammaproteobacteria bacterium]|nr:8-amino-7-oxononanoate synthase [Gammaproteobacteria bacterium]MCY4282239.1 8-amino-7-oxononanoate synthase [Gammaproteobacteria bacterium]MCY4337450.1 8-amino-7-oxononanoate synthase [Gammaproteobacteria bacterium]